MDSRRPPAYAPAPLPPRTTVDSRTYRPPQQYPPQTPYPQSQPHSIYPQPGPPAPPSAPGPSLPPIQSYGPPRTPQAEQGGLPPFQYTPHTHEAPREGEYHTYNQHAQPSHAPSGSVSRTFSHDSAQQQRTPTTPATSGAYPPSSGTDGAPPTQHAPPPQRSMEHPGPYSSYPSTNGVVVHGLPPPQYQQQHDPSQHYTTPTESHHYAYQQPPPQAVQYHQPYGAASGNMVAINSQKRKQMRATQACEQCRSRKQKCDEGTPCNFCKENSLTCQYRDTPPVKTDKNMERLLSYMEDQAIHAEMVSAKLSALDSKIESFDKRLSRAENGGFGATPLDEVQQLKRKPEIDDHRTAPHKLILLWPSVGRLLRSANVEHDEGYVMAAEDRGILRLWTRGEGIDDHDGTQPGGPASPARSEESGDGNAPTPPDGLWGSGFSSASGSDVRRSEPYCAGGLKPDGSLDLDVTTINALYDSYLKHMHIMHPFLDKGRVHKLLDRFIQNYGTGHPNLRQKFNLDGNSDHERPMKRQRSNGPMSSQTSGHDGRRQVPYERSPGNAIVWLVLALGKIFLHKDPLPRIVTDGRIDASTVVSHGLSGNFGMINQSPVHGGIKPAPMSPRSSSTTGPTPPSVDGAMRGGGRSRRSSTDGLLVSGARNLDVIPGLAYYAKAAEILGDQGDGNDLVHAQMFLLAGLYKGQLARVKESMSWITMAGRAVITLLDRYKLYNEHYWSSYGDPKQRFETGQARIKDKRHSLIVLASWTCLQLESDILAELRLPSSGIQTIENMLLLPHNMPDEEKESYEGLTALQQDIEDKDGYDTILLFYTAQTFLRKRLNQVHKEMYGNSCLEQTISQVREMLHEHENILGYWRSTLPPQLTWVDDDPPPENILEARLRAKYWGARYVINRPFLDYALHIMPHVKGGRSVEDAATDVNENPREKAEIHLFNAIASMSENEIWMAAKRCIDAAMKSTVAFDNVPDRLIVTNIHGTAHAQFGNMLVLAATHHNSYLKAIIPEGRFEGLLARTIRFLRRLEPISPTCKLDAVILEKIQQFLFGVPADAKHIYHNEREPSSLSNSFSA